MASTDQYNKIHQFRLNYILNQIEKLNLPTNSTILDVGCYPPYIFDNLKSKYKMHGISSPQEPITDSNIRILNIESDSISFDLKFNLIIFTEILEHLTNPIVVLEKLTKLLKPGGLILITTPNVNRWQNLFLMLFDRNIYFPIYQLNQPINFRHQREYSLSELTQITSLNAITLKTFIAYPPFRKKNSNDKIMLKLAKYLIYVLELVLPSRADSLLGIFQK